jgi:hypothetical protein
MEGDTFTPSVMRYSDQYPAATPVMDLNYSVCIPSNGGTFTPNQEIRIPINVPADCFVDTKRAFLKYTINNNHATVDAYLDPMVGGAAFIENWRVVSGTGALLEEIIHYNALCGLIEIQKAGDVVGSVGNLTQGSSDTPMTDLSISAAAGATSTFGTVISATQSKVITHRPNSAVFNCDKYMPFGYTQGTSYVALTLAALTTPLRVLSSATDITDWTISNVELHLPVLRPGNEFAQNFRTLLASGMPINIHAVGFQNSQQNIALNSVGAQTLTFSTRKRSVKSVLTVLRINAQLTTNLCDSSTAFKNCGITEYQYSIGGVRVPSANIKANSATDGNDVGELFMNTSMALGHFDSSLRAASTNASSYYNATDTTGSSRCAFAVDLESYGEGLAGKNLAGQGLPLVLYCQTAATKAQSIGAVLADLYIMHDIVFKLDGVSGTLSASS